MPGLVDREAIRVTSSGPSGGRTDWRLLSLFLVLRSWTSFGLRVFGLRIRLATTHTVEEYVLPKYLTVRKT